MHALLVAAALGAVFTPLGEFTTFQSFSDRVSLSPDGHTAVGWSDTLGGPEAFIWTAGSGMQSLGAGRALAVTNGGTMIVGDRAGEAWEFVGGTGYGPGTALATDGTTVVGTSGGQAMNFTTGEDLGIGQALVIFEGTIYGQYAPPTPHRAWNYTTGQSLGEGYLYDVSDAGIAGATAGAYAAKYPTILPQPPATFASNAFAISRGGRMVGANITGQGIFAVIWENDGTASYLADWLPAGLVPTGWILREATDISDDGHKIAGFAERPDGVYQSFVVAVPEPATMTSSVIAVIALFAGRRRTHSER
jgi:hypothetical protein